jgi:23S rRNA-/tRNA-specific pseudouridylate synthase
MTQNLSTGRGRSFLIAQISLLWKSLQVFHSPRSIFVLTTRPGISTQPSLGNYRENVSECIRETLGLDRIFLPHRLDTDTSGILVFGKTLAFTQRFAKGSIQKSYRALVTWRGCPASPLPPTGTTLTHFMETSKNHPKFLHLSAGSDTKICQATLLRQSPVLTRTTSQWAERIQQLREAHPRLSHALEDWVFPYATIFDYFRATKDEKFLPLEPSLPPGDGDQIVSFCEIELALLTGRTHQLRAQV